MKLKHDPEALSEVYLMPSSVFHLQAPPTPRRAISSVVERESFKLGGAGSNPVSPTEEPVEKPKRTSSREA